MPKPNSNAGRIKLPEVHAPEGFRCVSVIIPDDDSHHQLMLRVLERYLTTQTYLERDDTREGAKKVSQAWLKALYQNRHDNQCAEGDQSCRTFYPGTSSLFEFYPPGLNTPTNSGPWDGVVWMTGPNSDRDVPWQEPYQNADVLCELPWNGDPLQFIGGLSTSMFPKVTITITGEGILEVHWLKVFQGGAALTVIDGDYSKASFITLQLGSLGNIMEDILAAIDAVLTEDASPVEIAEYELVGEGEHTIEIWFLPYFNVDNPLDVTAILGSGFGGGIRKIELCGSASLTEFRQNPDNACELQYRNNPSSPWLLAFDHSLCQPSVTVEAGTGEGFTFTPDITIVNSSVESYTNNPTTFAPDITGTGTADTAICYALRAMVRATIEIIIKREEGERNVSRLALAAGAVIATAAAFAFAGPIGGYATGLSMAFAFTAVWTQGFTHIEELKALRNDTAFIDSIVCCAYDALKGTRPTPLSFQLAFSNGCNTSPVGIELSTALEDMASRLEAFSTFLEFAQDAIQFVSQGLLGDECATNCGNWTEVIDFALTDGGFGTGDIPVNNSIRSSGTGWVNGRIVLNDNVEREGAWIVFDFPANVNITGVQFEYDLVKGSYNVASLSALSLRTSDTAGTSESANNLTDGSNQVYIGEPNSSADYLRINVFSARGTSGSGSVIIRSVTVSGEGFNPFI